MNHWRRAFVAVGAGALTAALGIGGVALVRATHDIGAIHACVKDNGKVRIVDDAAGCVAGESPLSWNVSGPAGPAGPPGPPGNDASVTADWHRSEATSFVAVDITGGVLDPTVVASVAVDAGASLVWGRVNVAAEPAPGAAMGVQCQLRLSGSVTDILDGVRIEVGASSDGEFRDGLALMGAVDAAAPSTVSIVCSKDAAGSATALQPSLLVVDVGTVDVSTITAPPP